MKFSCQVLALCIVHQTTAFYIQAPKAITFGYLRSSNGDGTSEAYASAFKNAYPPQPVTALKNSEVSEIAGVSVDSAFPQPVAERVSGMATVKPSYGGPMATEPTNTQSNTQVTNNIWDTTAPMIIQGGSLRTWSESVGAVDRVQVVMKTEGRPLNANIELWHGPENTPLKMAIYSENGSKRPFSAVIETPDGQNTVAIRNTGQMEFPLAAWLDDDVEDVAKELHEMGTLKTMQGGAILTYPFDHSVSSVQVLLKTGGRPLNARIELLQGPNNDKQVIDVYTEDGNERPFFAVIETPGSGNVVRIVNTASVEFPITACVQSYLIDATVDETAGRGWNNGDPASGLSSRNW